MDFVDATGLESFVYMLGVAAMIMWIVAIILLIIYGIKNWDGGPRSRDHGTALKDLDGPQLEE